MLESYVTNAEQNGGGWIQVVLHNVCQACTPNAISPSDFNAFLNWLQPRAAAGTVVKPVRQVIDEGARPPTERPPGTTPPPPAATTPKNLDLRSAVPSLARRAAAALRQAGRRKLLRRGGFRFNADFPASGRLLVELYRPGRATRLALGSRTFSSARSETVRVRLTRVGRLYLQRARRPRVVLRLSFAPSVDRPAVRARKLVRLGR